MSQIAILCGGKGSRLKSVIGDDLPKAMVNINDRPFLDYILASITESCFSSVVLCTGHSHSRIFRAYGSSAFGLDLIYSTDPPNAQLGTGGAVLRALPHLEDHFIVLYGDSLLRIDYSSVLESHLRSAMPLTMTALHSSLTPEIANIWISDGSSLYSKDPPPPSANYIDYGLNCIAKQPFLDFTKHHRLERFDLSLFQTYCTSNSLCDFTFATAPYIEVGTPQALQAASNTIPPLTSCD